MIRTYSELSTLTSFKDRFRYLKLDGEVGEATFGFDRYLNQLFYRSQRWRLFGVVVFSKFFLKRSNPELVIKDIFSEYPLCPASPMEDQGRCVRNVRKLLSVCRSVFSDPAS